MDGTELEIFASYKLIFAAAATLMLCAVAVGMAQPGTTVVPVRTMAIGAAPADFEFARTGQGAVGKWAVVGDSTALGDRAIEQGDKDATDYRFPLAIYKPVSARNVEVSVRFKAIAGRVDQAGGVVLRLSDANNYYVARANALEDNVRFYRVVNGRREQIEGANLKVASNAWHTLALKADGDRFTVTFNGKELYSATDRTFTGAGRIALWTKSDSVTRFDRIEITPLQ